MANPSKIPIASVLVFVIAFAIYAYNIIGNLVPFGSDEMYWISTARIVPILASGDTRNRFWDEYYGFTNFNGAKLVYGAGLALAGYSSFDEIGVPPQTYFTWHIYDAAPFPPSHALYPILRDARIISALAGALAAAAIVVSAYAVSGHAVAAVFTGLLFAMHPDVLYVSVHAFADSIFLLFESVAIYFFIKTIQTIRTKSDTRNATYMGIAIGLTAATKINGAMLLPIFLSIILIRSQFGGPKRNTRNKNAIIVSVLVAIAGCIGAFIFINPNLLFFHDVSFIDMIARRARITGEHMTYFSKLIPEHVLWTIPDRITMTLRHLFPVWLTLIVALRMMMLYIRPIRQSYLNARNHFAAVAGAGLLVWMTISMYAVFNDPRYVLPVLPFLLIAASVPFSGSVHRHNSS